MVAGFTAAAVSPAFVPSGRTALAGNVERGCSGLMEHQAGVGAAKAKVVAEHGFQFSIPVFPHDRESFRFGVQFFNVG